MNGDDSLRVRACMTVPGFLLFWENASSELAPQQGDERRREGADSTFVLFDGARHACMSWCD